MKLLVTEIRMLVIVPYILKLIYLKASKHSKYIINV